MRSRFDFHLQKVHMFNKSLEAVMLRLVEAERSQQGLAKVSQQAVAKGGGVTESEVQVFRNQLKV